jgi:methylthioxylose transferase
LWNVQETAPSAGQLAKAPFILYYPSSSGYFTKARYESPDVQRFLRDYEQLMRQGDVLHVGTHPPGLFLVYHGLIAIGKQWPGLLTGAWKWAPESVREATAVVADNTRSGTQPLSPDDAAVLWLAGLLVLTSSAATVVPLYGTLRLSVTREAAFVGAAFWPTVPAVAMFWPKSDAAFPFVSVLLVWCALSGWATGSRLRAIAAGLVLFVGLMGSLAFLPVAAFIALVIGHEAITSLRSSTRSYRQVILWSACGFAGFLLPIVLLRLTIHLPMERIWLWNYRNHAGFYTEYPRTHWQWLLVNPVELGIVVGAPIVVAAMAGGRRLATDGEFPSFLRRSALWGTVVWGLLWVTGKNSGEAARLWLLFMPGLVALAALEWAAPISDGERMVGPVQPTKTGPILWLALQLGVAILTVHRIGGFHFEWR